MGFKPHHALHSCASPEHYTPAPYVEAARYVLGAIDLDPASSVSANATVRAKRFYAAADNGLAQPWHGRVFLNPPGDKRGVLIKVFWRKACEHALFGGPGAAVLWVGYSLGPIPRLSGCEPFADGTPCPGPTSWPHVFVDHRGPCTTGGGRIMWVDGVTGEPGPQPGHGNYFCLLGGDRGQRARFRERFGAFGACITPARLPKRARHHAVEITLAIKTAKAPMTRSMLARACSMRKRDVLRTVDDLILAGQIAVRGDGRLVVPDGREPRNQRVFEK